jgi:ADP-ribosylglycohydrolase/fructose-1,6-bisphosphatase/inositol monophosphatase family enzyme
VTTPAYGGALQAAIDAARAAARLLVEEFHRPGGPRGGRGDCPADRQAEVLVREALLAAFPDFGFVAEEDPAEDRTPTDAGRHAWVVDPNDGTSYFQRGYRGASVSVGLLRGGVPVLGVVLAHTAPTGGEDLVAWAEGEGPVRRNGEPVPTTDAQRGGLADGDVVLVSRAADDYPVAVTQLLAPARFRPLTSIAYRLALVAAGEAAAAVSLQDLDAHDVAAGHALLRGAGLALLDAAGREVTYRPAGRTPIGPVAAGAPAVAAELLHRFASRASAPPREKATVDLAVPEPGRPVADVALLRRAQGALMGQLCGDALGAQVEFQRPDEIAEDWPEGVTEMKDGGTWNLLAGQPTDDSELALALARSLLRRGHFDLAEVARSYALWYESGPFDVGHTTRAALSAAASAWRRGGDVAGAARGAALLQSRSNGALMRISPLGIFGHAAPAAELMEWARQDAGLTHPDPACRDASAVLVCAIATAVREGPGGPALADQALQLARREGLDTLVVDALERARVERPDCLTHQGLVMVALQNAFWQLRHAASAEEAIIDSVRQGGDTDTNAAIAGALTGAVHGVQSLPLPWRSAVLSCVPAAGAPGVARPRPPACWPIDALILAERLAAR